MAKHHSSREKRFLYKKLGFIIGTFLVVCCVLGFALRMIDKAPVADSESSTRSEKVVTIGGKEYTPKTGIKTVLMLGNDSSVTRTEQVGAGQCDTIELLVIDSRKDIYTRVTINRNTMAEIESFDESGKSIGTSTAQICLAYAEKDDVKGSENVANAISKLLYGQKIDEYVSISMDAIPKINKLLGGVEVTIEDDFSKSDPSLKMGETIRLTDEQAEHFIHDRMNVADGTNENRIKRQNTYLAGAKKQLIIKCKEQSSYAMDFYNSMNEYMTTSLNKKHFAKLVNDLVMYDDAGREILKGTTKIGRFEHEEYTLDQDSLDELVVSLFYDPVED